MVHPSSAYLRHSWPRVEALGCCKPSPEGDSTGFEGLKKTSGKAWRAKSLALTLTLSQREREWFSAPIFYTQAPNHALKKFCIPVNSYLKIFTN